MHVPLSEIITLQKGKKPKTQSTEMLEGFMPYVDIKAFEQGLFDSYTDGNDCSFCDEGDILIVCDGSRSGLVGRAKQGAIGSTLAKVSASTLIDKRFLFYFIQKHYIQLNTNPKGTGTPHVNPTLLGSFPFPILSTTAQQCIVDKIDALFSKLNKGVEMLRIIRQQLKTYRQAVLKWAFEGKLSNSKWELSTVGELAVEIRIGPFGTLLHKEDYVYDGIPVINPKHLNSYKITNDKSVSISSKKASGLSSYTLTKNDVLIARRGEMGRTAYVSEREVGWLCGTGSMIIRFPKKHSGLLMTMLLSSEQVRKYLQDNCNGTTMSNLNEKIVKKLPFPRIPESAQERLLAEIESRLSVCDKLESIVDESLSQAEALKQSILKKAFESKLVPQDPNDEPAEKLLERIKAANKAMVATTKLNRRKK